MSCDNIHTCRTLPSLPFSCASTVFLCAWAALHPNVPEDPDESWRANLWRRIRWTFLALLTPEYILLLACEDWQMGSHYLIKLLEKHPNCGWTETHALFAYMGGFRLLNSDGTKKSLSRAEFFALIDGDQIDIPQISLSEIQDKSKSDTMAKTIAAVQATWFLLQTITRAIQRLPLTELELTTVAYVVMFSWICFCWWNKPVNVRVPVYVRLREGKGKTDKPQQGQKEEEKTSEGSAGNEKQLSRKDGEAEATFDTPNQTVAGYINSTGASTNAEIVRGQDDGASATNCFDTSAGTPANTVIVRGLDDDAPITNRFVDSAGTPANAAISCGPDDGASTTNCFNTSTDTPANTVIVRADDGASTTNCFNTSANTPANVTIVREPDDNASITNRSQGDTTSDTQSDQGSNATLVECGVESQKSPLYQLPTSLIRVKLGAFLKPKGGKATFWEYLSAYLFYFIGGALFGAIHCIAWNWSKPGTAVRYLWRSSAVFVTVFADLFVIYLKFKGLTRSPVLGAVSILVYVASRVTLVVLTFQALRSLPFEAHVTPSWVSIALGISKRGRLRSTACLLVGKLSAWSGD